MRGLKGKVVLITGAAAGIGLATAQRFYDEGSTLLLCDMTPVESFDLVKSFGEGAAERVTYVRADVTKDDDVAMLEGMIKEKGLDVLINNAGITRDSTLAKMTMEQWNQVISVNLTAVFRLGKMAAEVMRGQGRGGVILNAASVVAHYGNFGQTNYAATKAGVVAMTKTWARELGRNNIRVNAVAPGFTLTDMVRKMPENVLAALSEKTPLKRCAEPSEIAAAYAFLASDDAAFITGTTLNVDGGLIS